MTPTACPAWQRLAGLKADAHDAARNTHVELDGFTFDFSRYALTAEILDQLIALAEAQDLAGWRERLFAGELVNTTEQRAAMHMALRAERGDAWSVLEEVLDQRARCHAFADTIRSEAKITDVVNIGIGGSHLGPALVCDALLESGDLRTHFVANVDGADLGRVLAQCEPESTLFIVASKTFTTQETLLNARGARAWLVEALGEDAVGTHFAAVSAYPARAAEFGIPADRVFAIWDWVGGRYSLWGAIGLPAMIALGRERFDALLAGAREIDDHFLNAHLAENIPVLMGLIGVWNRNFAGATSHAVLPYADALNLLPAYLQQLVMESLGKRVDRDGHEVGYPTGPVVWGMPGTNGQHAFHQLLHQGTDAIAVDFIGFRDSVEGLDGHQRVLVANLRAQADALAAGRRTGDPHRDCPGGRGSNVLMFDRLTPRNLGRLIALYEHQVFVQAVIWNLNPFDQFGVELGKDLASEYLETSRR